MRFFFFMFLIVLNITGYSQKAKVIEGEIYVKIKKNHVSKVKTVSAIKQNEFILPGFTTALGTKKVYSAKKITKEKDSKNGVERIFKVEIDKNTPLEALLLALKETAFYEYVEPKYYREIIFTPSDTSFSKLWHLKKIKAPEAWDVNPGGSPVVVAVIDNAVQTNHLDLAANTLRGFDAADGDNNPNPPTANFTHGTHVAGIVSAVNNNITGVAAAANNSVKILPVKATPDAFNANLITHGFEGMLMAADSGAKIMSISWGSEGYSQIEQDIINFIHSKNIMIVAAAGNSANENLIYPASYEHVISVAALDTTDIKSSFSSYNSKVDISAPGRRILSTIPFDQYIAFSGTSMATPLVSSCIGYLWSCFPSMTLTEMEALITSTADNISLQNPTLGNKLGAGRINLLNAVSCKSQNLDTLRFSFPNPPFICAGDTITLNAPVIAGLKYKWLINNTLSGDTLSFLKITQANTYDLQIEKGNCLRRVGAQTILNNLLVSPQPISTNLVSPYCTGPYVLNASATCNSQSSYTVSYTGPEVGYDGFLSSGPDPSFTVNNIPGLVDSMFVSITWEKKDGGGHLSCPTPTGPESPFNEELSFALVSPSGKLFSLVGSDTYTRGTTGSGVVTTVFSSKLADTLVKGLPVSGRFRPANVFTELLNKTPFGTWTLLADDNAGNDPLCLSGFSITFYTNASSASNTLSWYNASGQFLNTGNSFTIPNLNIGTHGYQVSNKCDFRCASSKVPVNIDISPVPRILGIKLSDVLLSPSQIAEIQSSLTCSYSVNNAGLYTVSGTNVSSVPFSYLIANTTPMVSTVTLCDTATYVLIATGCNSNITWSTGETNKGILVSNLTPNSTFTASCNKTWDCPTPPPSSFSFSSASNNVTLSGLVQPIINQNFNGLNLNSTQKILPSSIINYKANNAINLLPGFSAGLGNVFTAQIGGCN